MVFAPDGYRGGLEGVVERGQVGGWVMARMTIGEGNT